MNLLRNARMLVASLAALAGAVPALTSAAACVAPAPPVGNALPTPRLTQNFNREWKFQLGDPAAAQAPEHDDKTWHRVHLPHTFSLPYFASEAFIVGTGWYRKTLDVPRAWLGKRVSLEFEAAFQVAEVFVNGARVGEHRGGYTGFAVDLTPALKAGRNQIAVRVNNQWQAGLAPRAGEHVFSGGLYRDVHLVVSDPLHVAWHGTFVSTPQVSHESAVVNVKTEINNSSAVSKTATVYTAVLDANGRVVASMQSTHSAPAGQTTVFDQTSAAIASPRLWSPEAPNLYSVRTAVLDCGRVVDNFESPLGFRWFEFTADRGFFLNGQHRYLRGANVHQDQAGWGDAVTNASLERDVQQVKAAGFDFIRGSHYPHDPAFSQATDRLGMLFWSEAPFWGIGGFKPDGYWNASAYPPNAADRPAFEASARQQLAEMIRIHRNHPSIITWSMGNEAFFSDRATLPEVGRFLEALVALSRQLDPTRPAAVGGVQRPLDELRIDRIGDLAGYNGDGAAIATFRNPGVPNLVSEYGSVIADRPGEYAPGWGDLAPDDGQAVHPWRSGQAIWCAFDHGSIAGRKFGSMGIVDYFRLPKRAWYWYRNQYRKVPPPTWPSPGTPARLLLSADKTTLSHADGTDDAHLVVTVADRDGKPLSNNVPVRLSIESGPGEFPTGRSIDFAPGSDIAIRDGQAAITWRAYEAGTAVIRASSPGLADARLKLSVQGGPRFFEGQTALVEPRPYSRFVRAAAAKSMDEDTQLGTGNPTRASSAAADHVAGLANDTDLKTYWQATQPGPAWWQVDLERLVHVSRTRLVFPSDGAWRYRIEASADGRHWALLADRSGRSSLAHARDDEAMPGVVGRFLRVSFTATPAGVPAALTEFTAFGRPQAE